jgi:glycosyltransferase involved in cell wall biosynthesis
MENLNNPLVSVIIPTYNHADVLTRAVQSVLNQIYANFELIVVDDCSTDDTQAVIKKFKDDRIIYVRHSENKGLAATRNTGMNKAKGGWFAFLDADDEFLPDRLKIQVEILPSLSQDTDLVIADLYSLNKHCLIKKKRLSAGNQNACGYIRPSAKFPAAVYSPPSTWFLHRSCVSKVGLFDELMFGIEDADYFVRVLEQGRIYYLNHVVIIKHVHPRQKREFSPRYYQGRQYFLKKYLAKMEKDRRYLSRFYVGIAKDFLSWSRPREAKKYFLMSFITCPRIDYFFKFLSCYIKK